MRWCELCQKMVHEERVRDKEVICCECGNVFYSL